MPVDHSSPSVCIPRVFANITKRDIREVFEQVLGVRGCVERVDLISKTDQQGTPFGRVFVHFRFWPQTDQAQAVRKQLLDGESVKIVYDDPWYWKCGVSGVPKPEFTRERAAPYVDLTPKPANTPAAQAPADEEPLLDCTGLPLLPRVRQSHDDPRENAWTSPLKFSPGTGPSALRNAGRPAHTCLHPE